MLFQTLLCVVTLCADPTGPVVVVVNPPNAAVRAAADEPPPPAPAVVTTSSAPEASAEAPRSGQPNPPRVRQQQKEIVAQLRVQTALRVGRRLLDEGKYAAAVTTLEPMVAHADGSELFLETLDLAYRKQMALLIREHRTEEAVLIEERRQAVAVKDSSSKSPTAAPQEASVAAREAQPVEPAPATAGAQILRATSRRPELQLAKLPVDSETFGRVLPRKAQPESAQQRGGYVARAKLDDSEEAAAEKAAPKFVEPDAEFFEKAERFWQGREFAKALSCYEAAYQANPSGKIQAARNRYGYCLLLVAYEKYEKLTKDNGRSLDDKNWADWEAEIQQGRRLVHIDSYRRFADDQMRLLRDRRAAIPALSTASTQAVATPVETIKSQETTPVSVPFKHLPGEFTGGWKKTETANFVVIHRDLALAEEVAVIAETARRHAHEMWFPNEPLPAWEPKCEIVLYPTAQEFAQYTHQMAESPAFTKCDVREGWVASRRIELRVDAADMKPAILPHEIAHAVLAGKFGRNSPPRWADEGMAVLTEPLEKQNQHLSALVQVRASRRGFTCEQVIRMSEYPSEVRMFYAHSVGVCRYLVDRGGREKLVEFVRTAVETRDYDGALQRVYGMRAFTDLEAGFDQFVSELQSGGTVASASRQ